MSSWRVFLEAVLLGKNVDEGNRSRFLSWLKILFRFHTRQDVFITKQKIGVSKIQNRLRMYQKR
jgi:hypothetical protein